MIRKVFFIVFLICLLSVMYYSIPQKIPVLTYHNFSKNGKSDTMTITSETFEKQMKFLSDHKYHSLTLDELKCFMEEKCEVPKKSVLITIDDGWRSSLGVAAPILKKYHLNATIFYIGKNIDKENKWFLNKKDLGIIKKLYPNIEIASHTYNLHEENAFMLSEDELKDDMKNMKKVINSQYFAYPYGKYSDNYIKALKKEDYKLAFTFGPGKNHRKLTRSDSMYEIPRLNMSAEMPFWKFVLRLIWLY